MSRFIKVEPTALSEDAYEGLLREVVSRDGTDYGAVEQTLAHKLDQLRRQIATGFASIVFDTETELVDVVAAEQLATLLLGEAGDY